jgi:hypothetical protein
MKIFKQAYRVVLALIMVAATLLWGESLTILGDSFTTQAEARIGRPLTPMSYAGVARRTTRRAAAYGAAGAAAAGAYYYAAPGCAQVVNSYGQIVYRCP